jgi:hypothetical protein
MASLSLSVDHTPSTTDSAIRWTGEVDGRRGLFLSYVRMLWVLLSVDGSLLARLGAHTYVTYPIATRSAAPRDMENKIFRPERTKDDMRHIIHEEWYRNSASETPGSCHIPGSISRQSLPASFQPNERPGASVSVENTAECAPGIECTR